MTTTTAPTLTLDDATRKRIEGSIKNNDVVLFMKGSPDFPMCGFSAAVVEILNRLGVAFHAVDILQDNALREGIKAFSDWPTTPQLYIKEEFIGGCDIVREMFNEGELQERLRSKGLKVAASA